MDMGVGGISISRPGFVGPDSLTIETNANNGSTTTESPQLDSDVYDNVSQNVLRETQPDDKVLDLV